MPRHRPTDHLHIGVLFCGDVQLLDLAAVDLFAMCSKTYLRACEFPSPLIALGFDNITFYHIGEGVTSPIPSKASANESSKSVPAPPNTTLVSLTPSLNLQMRLTHDLASPAVRAGKLDVLLVPGPDPNYQPSEAMATYLLTQTTSPATDVLSVCTGIFPLARSPGVLDGRVVTGPRPLVGLKLKGLNKMAAWKDERRWEVDVLGKKATYRDGSAKGGAAEALPGGGELWTSGGITEGTEMVAAYLREKMSVELAQLVCESAGVGNRPREYEQTKVGMGAGMVWLLLRSVWRGLWSGGKT